MSDLGNPFTERPDLEARVGERTTLARILAAGTVAGVAGVVDAPTRR